MSIWQIPTNPAQTKPYTSKGGLQLGDKGTLYTRLGKLLKVDGTAITDGKLYMSARGKGAGYLNSTGRHVPFLSAAKIGQDYSFFKNIETDGGLLASLDSVEKQRAVKATRRPIMSVAAMRHGLLRQRHIPRPPV